MKMTGKIRSTALAVTLIAAAVPALPSTADAAWGWRGGGWRGGWGWGGVGLGLAAGALFGAAIAAPYYGGYGYGPGYYGYNPGYYGYYAPAYYAPYPAYYGGWGWGGGWGRPVFWHGHRHWRHW
jgi:hypothetical protein